MTVEQKTPHPSALAHLPSYAPSLLLRIANWIAEKLEKLGLRPLRVNTKHHHELLARGSRDAATLEGPDWLVEEEALDALWHAEMQSLDASMDRGKQPLSARLAMFGGARLALDRRCSIYRHLNSHPSLIDTPLPKPLIIVGLPRTGSTLLQRLLACDSRMSSFAFWELLDPVPPPKLLGMAADFRLLKAKLGSASLDLATPGHMERINAFHPTDPEYADEETNLMWSAGLMNAALWHYLDDATFRKVLDSKGKRAAYRFLKRSLQVMIAQRPKHPSMVLKSPFHGLYLEAMLEAFPDAVLVSLHRNPAEVVESWVSFIAMIAATSFARNTITTKQFSERQMTFLKTNAQRLARFLPEFEENNPGRHLALSFYDLVEDPIAVVNRVYGLLDMAPPSPEDTQTMTELLGQRAARQSWSTKMSIDQLGFTSDQLNEDFSEYRKVWGSLLKQEVENSDP